MLVSLDEAVLPPQITKVRNETNTTEQQNESVEAAAQGPNMSSPEQKKAPVAGQHPDITIRYTKREIL